MYSCICHRQCMKKDFLTIAVSGMFEFSGNGFELGENKFENEREKITFSLWRESLNSVVIYRKVLFFYEKTYWSQTKFISCGGTKDVMFMFLCFFQLARWLETPGQCRTTGRPIEAGAVSTMVCVSVWWFPGCPMPFLWSQTTCQKNPCSMVELIFTYIRTKEYHGATISLFCLRPTVGGAADHHDMVVSRQRAAERKFLGALLILPT